ncbi:hypothetical protein [Streptomyces collinus]|uniref:hypothetical protein n=1 Tax=Streptomyces collinus TaxID=42684 RepID=UPI0011DD7FD7|nr:hypothetical protein [Streptomyces collinus]
MRGVAVDRLITALGVRRATVGSWESAKTEPRPPQRNAYARLLEQLAQLYPTEGTGALQERTGAKQALQLLDAVHDFTTATDLPVPILLLRSLASAPGTYQGTPQSPRRGRCGCR